MCFLRNEPCSVPVWRSNRACPRTGRAYVGPQMHPYSELTRRVHALGLCRKGTMDQLRNQPHAPSRCADHLGTCAWALMPSSARIMSALPAKIGHGSARDSVAATLTSSGVPHSNESPPLSVSVSGKRDFAGQRQRRRKGPSHSTDRQQRRRPRTKTHQFGAICTTPGNLCLYGTDVVGLRGLEPPTKRL
jgi:hypothetical protein